MRDVAKGTVVELKTDRGDAHVAFFDKYPHAEGDLVRVLPPLAMSRRRKGALDWQKSWERGFWVFMSLGVPFRDATAGPVDQLPLKLVPEKTPILRSRNQTGTKVRWHLWRDEYFGRSLKRLNESQKALSVKQWVDPTMLSLMLAVGYRPELDAGTLGAVGRLAAQEGIAVEATSGTARAGRHFIYYADRTSVEAALQLLKWDEGAEVMETGPGEFALLLDGTPSKQRQMEKFAAASGGEYDGWENMAPSL